MTTHLARTLNVASVGTAAGRATATTTANAEIRPRVDPEIDQDHQHEGPEDQAVSNGRESAETTTETATFADGHRSDIGIAMMAGIATTAATTAMVVAVVGIDRNMEIEIKEERRRKRKRTSQRPLLPKEEARR